MAACLAARLLLALITIWAISVVTFVIVQLPPGDFVDACVAKLSASGSMVSTQEAEASSALYGLDQPIRVQYLEWAAGSCRAMSACRWSGAGRSPRSWATGSGSPSWSRSWPFS
ncbi:MAG: hypothetical protein RMK81_07150 [Geminicoccaceae bacterium]|nr:hypothetical protein [Geminicoccaceae bacterium]